MVTVTNHSLAHIHSTFDVMIDVLNESTPTPALMSSLHCHSKHSYKLRHAPPPTPPPPLSGLICHHCVINKAFICING